MHKKKWLYRFYVLLIFFSVVHYSCTKEKKDLLSGTWKVFLGPSLQNELNTFAYESPDSINFLNYYLEISGDKFQTIYENPRNNNRVNCAQGNVFIKNAAIILDGPLASCAGLTYQGDWVVTSLTDRILIINQRTDNGFMTLELIKEAE